MNAPLIASIVLVGLPGAGKSVVGQAVATRLGAPFLDFDAEIERRVGLSVADIFERRGEAYFRDRERDLTLEVSVAPARVLSPGGGWITDPTSVALLRPRSRIIYLQTPPATALARLGADRQARPLLRGPDPLGALSSLLASREALYRSADEVVDTEMLDLQHVTELVVRLARGGRAG
ncbi:MAG: shikimate kinase [Gemmatimonadaceae bacterium]